MKSTSNTPQQQRPIRPTSGRTKILRIVQKKRVKFILLGCVIITLITVVVSISMNIFKKDESPPQQIPLVTEQDRTAQVPFYRTLLPAGKTIEELGGWTRVSPTDRNAVFAFTDYIDNNRIVVSQQPLPEDFKEDTAAQVEGLAKSYKSSEKITVNGMTVHFAQSAKGPQAVIFVKEGLLVTIRSSVTIPTDSWISYINSLQ